MFENISQKGILAIASGFLLVLVVTGSWLHWQMISSRHEQLSVLSQRVGHLESNISKSTANERYALLKKQVREYDKRLPNRTEVAAVLEDVSRELQKLGVSERGVVTGTTVRTGEILQIPMNVGFKGSFGSVTQLLNHLDQSSRLVRVEQLVISRDMNSSAKELQVTTHLRSFSRTDEKQP